MEPDTVDGASDAKRVKKEVDKEEEAQKDELKKQVFNFYSNIKLMTN